jgi:hypothetical protein
MISDYIAYWTLDEASGNVIDSGPSGLTGTNNGTTSTDGRIGKGRNFTSAGSQYISMGNVLDFTTNDFSIAFWFNSTSGASGYFVNKSQAGSGAYVVYFNGSGFIALYLQTNDSNWKQETYEINLADGAWHHFIGIRSGASTPTLTIYIDGVSVSTTPQGSGTVTTVTNASNFQLSNSVQFYNGAMDEVKIYNRILSAVEANQLYTTRNNKFNNSGIRPRPFAPGLAR